jgi:uncharacterized RmlC-like cupin family protein
MFTTASAVELRGYPMTTKAKPSCQVFHVGQTYVGKQNLQYFAGISAESAGAKGICMHLLRMKPGDRAKAHMHENHETAVYVLSGEAQMWFGDDLAEHRIVKAGDMVYIPAGVPHVPANLSDEPVIAVIARTDPNEQESVVLLPELDSKGPA